MSSHHTRHSSGKLVEGPDDTNYGSHPSESHKGGPGVYDGAPDLPKRTPGHGGPPEKVYDEQPPLKKGEG